MSKLCLVSAREFVSNLYFNKGDILTIEKHHAPSGNGLTYESFTGVAQESGITGGWDVYDILDQTTGAEKSVYGFSIYKKER